MLQGAGRGVLWLTAAGLLWAACDVLENKTFPPPPSPPVYDPGIYRGLGGQGYGGSGSGYGGSSGGGTGGSGGRAVRPDGGVSGLGGAGMSCGPLLDSCISSCSIESPFTGTPSCDPTRGIWICPPGLVLRSTCPAGSCATTFLYCCDTMTGAREPAGCTQGGYRGLCPSSNYDSLTQDACIPDQLGVSTCLQLRQRACSSAGLECHGGGYDCGCVVGGDGGLVWSCPGLF